MSGLRSAFDSPEARQRYVRRLFATIADRYDLITVVLSYGRDRAWKRRLIDLAQLAPGQRVLDLACGTGDIALAAATRGANALGLDVTPRMIALARAKARRAPPAGARQTAPRFVVADMMALPLPDACIDVVTTGYGLRNVPALGPAIDEIARVLRPGGRFLSLDFNRPESTLVRGIYLAYLTVVGSALGVLLHRDADTYRYIPHSIRRYPGAESVARQLRQHGFEDVSVARLLGGLMAIHVATYPGAARISRE